MSQSPLSRAIRDLEAPMPSGAGRSGATDDVIRVASLELWIVDPTGKASPTPTEGIMHACRHLDQIRITALPESIAGCEECLEIGSTWLHLRMCMTCGKLGCCDSSPNRHASGHAREDGHAIARSAEPGEDWSWCFVDEVAFVVEPSETAA